MSCNKQLRVSYQDRERCLCNTYVTDVWSGIRKRDWFFGLWFLKCACTVLYLGYRHALFVISFLTTRSQRTAKALARLCFCAGSPETLLVAFVIDTCFRCAGSYLVYATPMLFFFLFFFFFSSWILQWIIITTTAFVPKDVAIKMNLLL